MNIHSFVQRRGDAEAREEKGEKILKINFFFPCSVTREHKRGKEIDKKNSCEAQQKNFHPDVEN